MVLINNALTIRRLFDDELGVLSKRDRNPRETSSSHFADSSCGNGTCEAEVGEQMMDNCTCFCTFKPRYERLQRYERLLESATYVLSIIGKGSTPHVHHPLLILW